MKVQKVLLSGTEGGAIRQVYAVCDDRILKYNTQVIKNLADKLKGVEVTDQKIADALRNLISIDPVISPLSRQDISGKGTFIKKNQDLETLIRYRLGSELKPEEVYMGHQLVEDFAHGARYGNRNSVAHLDGKQMVLGGILLRTEDAPATTTEQRALIQEASEVTANAVQQIAVNEFDENKIRGVFDRIADRSESKSFGQFLKDLFDKIVERLRSIFSNVKNGHEVDDARMKGNDQVHSEVYKP